MSGAKGEGEGTDPKHALGGAQQQGSLQAGVEGRTLGLGHDPKVSQPH